MCILFARHGAKHLQQVRLHVKACSAPAAGNLMVRRQWSSPLLLPCTVHQHHRRWCSVDMLTIGMFEGAVTACICRIISPCWECSTQYRMYTLCRSFDIWKHAENCRKHAENCRDLKSWSKGARAVEGLSSVSLAQGRPSQADPASGSSNNQCHHESIACI